MEDISGVFVPKTWPDEAIARANEYLNLYQTMHDEAQEYQSERDDALARAEAAERRAAELEAQLAANAGEWRPVSEAPVTKGRYLTLHFQEGGYPLYDIQHWHDGTVPPGPPAQWHGGWTKGDDWAQPAYWRPLPTPPEATQ